MRLWLFGELAQALGVECHTIRDIVRKWGIKPHRVPRSPAGKGLDLEQVIVVCRALNCSEHVEYFQSEYEAETQVRSAGIVVNGDDTMHGIHLNRPA